MPDAVNPDDYTKDIWSFIGAPVTGDFGGEGTSYDPAKQAELDYLINNGYLTETRGDESGGNKKYDVGPNAPQNLAGYGTLSSVGGSRLVTDATNKDLYNPAMTAESSKFGNLTPLFNVKENAPKWGDLLMQYAPMVVGLAATIGSGGAAAPWWVSMMEAGGKEAMNLAKSSDAKGVLADIKKGGILTADDFNPGDPGLSHVAGSTAAATTAAAGPPPPVTTPPPDRPATDAPPPPGTRTSTPAGGTTTPPGTTTTASGGTKTGTGGMYHSLGQTIYGTTETNTMPTVSSQSKILDMLKSGNKDPTQMASLLNLIGG